MIIMAEEKKSTGNLRLQTGLLFAGSHTSWMMLGGVIVQTGPCGKKLATMVTRVGVGAGEVDILHVFAQVEPAVLHHAAQRAAVPPTPVPTLLYIGVQAAHALYNSEDKVRHWTRR